MEINGIPNSISDDNLQSTVINVHATADDIEACHRIGKSEGNSKKTIVRKLLLTLLIGNIANVS